MQEWLVADGINDELDALTVGVVRSEIDNLVPLEASDDVRLDWSRLLLAGSILARSNDRVHQEAALRIATGAVILSDHPSVSDAGAVLMDKLANFRAVQLAEDRGLVASDLEERLGATLRMEAQRRHLEHAVLVQSSGQWLAVNEFQQRFWEAAQSHDWLSASAPTASGKTFVVLQWVTDWLRVSESGAVVYLAPTRALVSEIEGHLHDALALDQTVEVTSLPLRRWGKGDAAPKRSVYVLTQERLHLLLNNSAADMKVGLLIVDEAHKIGDSHRGVILQDAVERLARSNPGLRVAFISPATQNPGELLTDAPEDDRAKSVESDAPTVIQNLILAKQVPGRPKKWVLSLRQYGRETEVGVLSLSNSPSSIKKRIAFIAAAAGERGGTLVYANGAAEAEDIAELIYQLNAVPEALDSELVELIDLIKKGVHPSYRLAELVKRGVAFHYGNMPSLIRAEVERLFRRGKIGFLVCTSTLIEGVNLSCRTIVVRGPRKGRGHPMEAHDFWNLAGRAGRWGNEFQGNIICINPADTAAWPYGVPERSRYPIRREADAVISLGEALASYLDRRAEVDLADLQDAERFEQVGGYLLATYLRLGSLAETPSARRHDAATIARLEKSLAELARSIEIGPELALRHSGVSALGLQRLLEAFRGYKGDVANLLPVSVDSEDSFDRFATIMRRINDHLFPAFRPEGLVPYHALVVTQWLRGRSLAYMIRRNIKYHEDNHRSYKLSKLIRQTMDIVEQTARFLAPKFFSAYTEVLHLHLRMIDRVDLIEDGVDIGTQLEFGVSSTTLLSLIELGLSRMSAVALYERIARDDLSPEECITWVQERSDRLEQSEIPTIILREIRGKLLLGNSALPPTSAD